MSHTYLDDEDEFDRDDSCRDCGATADASDETFSCAVCEKTFATGRAIYACPRCKKTWTLGRSALRHVEDICPECRPKPNGECHECHRPVTHNDSVTANGNTLCLVCQDGPVNVWCPCCKHTHVYAGYLRVPFYRDAAGLQAAALVTHYRHAHLQSYDRAWQNPRYAAKIPNYNVEDARAKANDEAKRQLVRCIAKLAENDQYPEVSPVPPIELVGGFQRLQANEPETDALIDKVLAKLAPDSDER